MSRRVLITLAILFTLSITQSAWAACDCGETNSPEGLVRLRGNLQFSVIDVFRGPPSGQVKYKLADPNGNEISAKIIIELNIDDEAWNRLVEEGGITQSVQGSYAIFDYDLGAQGHKQIVARRLDFECRIQFIGVHENATYPGVRLQVPLLASDLAALAKKYRENVQEDFLNDNQNWFAQPEYELSSEGYQAWLNKDPEWAEARGEITPRLPEEVWDLEEFAEEHFNPELEVWIPAATIGGGAEAVLVPQPPKMKIEFTQERFENGISGSPNCPVRTTAYRTIREKTYVPVPPDTTYVEQPFYAEALWGDLPERQEKLQEFPIDQVDSFERRGCLEAHIHTLEAFNPGCTQE